MIDHSYTLSANKQECGLTEEILDELYKYAKNKWNDLKVETYGSNFFQSSSLSDERSLGLEDFQSTVQTAICEQIKKMRTNTDYEVSIAMLKNIIKNLIINEIKTRNPWSYWSKKNNAEIYKSLKDYDKKSPEEKKSIENDLRETNPSLYKEMFNKFKVKEFIQLDDSVDSNYSDDLISFFSEEDLAITRLRARNIIKLLDTDLISDECKKIFKLLINGLKNSEIMKELEINHHEKLKRKTSNCREKYLVGKV